jgi:nitrite reductase (NADH) large subunit
VTGIDLFSAGEFMGGDGTEEIVMSDPFGGVYKKLVIKDDKLIGACLYGDTADGSWYFKLLRDGRSVGRHREKLMFGESNIGDTGHEGHSKAASMPDEAEVCGCNGVSKGTICKAIRDKGLFTLDEVRKNTKASASCGSCTGLVEQILMFTAGGDYSATPKKKAVCGCTDASHQDARDAIRKEKYLTHAEVYEGLGWRTPNGCAPAGPRSTTTSSAPGPRSQGRSAEPLRQRAQPRQHPEGRHLLGHPAHVGRPSPRRTTAPHRDAADKYKIPTVKVTGGQRIDLLGVKKEDLQNVWKDIAMPAASPTASRCAPVKTCVGSEWCRFGTQDSTQMGKDLERALWAMYSPHKVKLAVSGCPRNCAEAGIKDVGRDRASIRAGDLRWRQRRHQDRGRAVLVQGEDGRGGARVQRRLPAALPRGGWYLERTVHYISRVGSTT